jgi:hypothetical protein
MPDCALRYDPTAAERPHHPYQIYAITARRASARTRDLPAIGREGTPADVPGARFAGCVHSAADVTRYLVWGVVVARRRARCESRFRGTVKMPQPLERDVRPRSFSWSMPIPSDLG